MKSSHISLRKRLIGITTLVMVALLVLFAAVLVAERAQLIQAKQEKLRNLVESTHGVVSHFEQAAHAGRMSQEEAQQAAIDAVRAMRYDKVEYFWINDLGKPVPKMIVHPTVPALDGKVLDAEKFNKATSAQEGIDGTKIALDRKTSSSPSTNSSTRQGTAMLSTYGRSRKLAVAPPKNSSPSCPM